MELLYLWIDNFRCIKKQGFNFGGKYKFDYHHETTELYCEINEQYIENFFGYRTSNVTAFIGANGSGKSTILDFIKLNISVDIGNTVLSFLCIYKEPGREEIFVYNSLREKIKLPNIHNQRFTIAEDGRIDKQLTSLLYPTAFIYYSQSIDFNTDAQECPIDLSTTKLLKDSNSSKYRYNQSPFYELERIEMDSQIKFASKYKNRLPFNLPKELQANPNYLDDTQITREINPVDGSPSIFFTCKNIIEVEKKEKRGSLSSEMISIYETVFWHSVRYKLTKTKSIEFAVMLNKEENINGSSTFQLLQNLYRDAPSDLPPWKYVTEFFSLLKELEEEGIMYYGSARFNFKLQPNGNYEKIDTFLSSYFSLEVLGDFLRLYWSGLSMGEQSYFSMFSRFYSVESKLKKFSKDINEHREKSHKMLPSDSLPQAIVLIDEGEIHMHPAWQKDFISNLIEFLPDVIRSSNLQLIITSNSPFLISDLPNYNVNFLRIENYKTVLDSSPPTSFAANIHDLLANSFFLETSIGKLAESKIDEVLVWLNGGNKLSKFRTDYIRKLIRLIDDLNIQNKLIQLLAIHTDGEQWELETLEQQKKLLDEKMNEIRKRKN